MGGEIAKLWQENQELKERTAQMEKALKLASDIISCGCYWCWTECVNYQDYHQLIESLSLLRGEK